MELRSPEKMSFWLLGNIWPITGMNAQNEGGQDFVPMTLQHYPHEVLASNLPVLQLFFIFTMKYVTRTGTKPPIPAMQTEFCQLLSPTHRE